MKKLLGVVAALLLAVPCVAQNRVAIAGLADAWGYAFGVNPNVSPLVVLGGGGTSGSYSITIGNNGNIALPDGTLVQPLSTNLAFTIGTGAVTETVTPSAVSCNQSDPVYGLVCFVTATFSNAHGPGARIASGDWGIGEAQLDLTTKFGGGLVAVSPALLKASGTTYTHAGINTFITGIKSASTTATVLDYSGVSVTATGALSYQATAGSSLASTTHVIY